MIKFHHAGHRDDQINDADSLSRYLKDQEEKDSITRRGVTFTTYPFDIDLKPKLINRMCINVFYYDILRNIISCFQYQRSLMQIAKLDSRFGIMDIVHWDFYQILASINLQHGDFSI